LKALFKERKMKIKFETYWAIITIAGNTVNYVVKSNLKKMITWKK